MQSRWQWLLWCMAIAWSSACIGASSTTELQIEHNGLNLNSNFVTGGEKDERERPIYLIVHGTWAHQGMEIIEALQELLEQHGVPSLAVTLSLGVDDRRGFLTCDDPILGNYAASVAEIDAWVGLLVEQGWRNIVIVGHSRGGAQVALYRTLHQIDQVQGLVLLAPALWHGDAVHARYGARSEATLDEVLEEARSTDAELIGPYPLLSCDRATARPSTFLSYYAATVPKHTPDLLTRVDVPVQVFVGSNDRIAQWSDQDHASLGEMEHVRFVEIDGAGHFFRDLYLDDVVDEMLGDAP